MFSLALQKCKNQPHSTCLCSDAFVVVWAYSFGFLCVWAAIVFCGFLQGDGLVLGFVCTLCFCACLARICGLKLAFLIESCSLFFLLNYAKSPNLDFYH